MKGYRTLAYNGLTAVAGSGLLMFLATVDWETAGFSPQTAVWIGIGAIVVDKLANAYLRTITTTPVGKRQ